ncbi:MAG: DNA-directed RNA polymerase subunit D [Halobacteriales archaeon]|nr:DNA-directed RNA polymerase subunit D [Halobacteriales archaeon]
MDVELVELGERETEFVVRGVTPAFANGVRRAIVGDVPTLAVDTVDFYENTSVMFDEVLALRIGLVPLTTDLDTYELPDKDADEDEHDPSTEVSLTLDVEAGDEERTVYSSDLEAEDPVVVPADKNVPLIKLKPGQAVVAECIARLGRGRDHAKHQGGVSVGYKHLHRLTEDGEERDAVRGVVETPDGELVDVTDERGMGEYEEYGVKDVEDAFVFHVESDGSMDASELVLRATETLSQRADELGDKVST